MIKLIEKYQDKFDDFLDGNWLLFLFVAFLFVYQFSVNFDSWIGL